MKFKYVMCGSFVPEKYEYIHKGTNHGLLDIEIPAPYSRDSKSEAMKDGHFAYRFVSVEGEVKIAVFSGEGFEINKDVMEHKYLKTWVEGSPLCFYNYDKFKASGGIIYEIPMDSICSFPEELSEDEIIAKIEKWKDKNEKTSWDIANYEVKASFSEMFPSLTSADRPVYIDNEAYSIIEEG